MSDKERIVLEESYEVAQEKLGEAIEENASLRRRLDRATKTIEAMLDLKAALALNDQAADPQETTEGEG